jgi:carbon monoxide dehydrogenase subunit G
VAIHLEGEFLVARKRDDVFSFLTDPNRFAPLLPDFESMTVQNDRQCTVKVKVGISHIRGTANVQLELVEAERPKRAAYQGKGSVSGSTVHLTASFDLADAGNGTQVNWKADTQLFGGLISMAGGLLEPLAKKNVQKLVDGLQKALS